MRIAIVSAWYPNKKNPLYGIFVQKQAQALSKQCSVFVLLLKWSLVPYEKEWKDGDVTVIEKGDFYFPNASETFLNFWASRYLRFFKLKHAKYNFELVHCHDHYGAFVGDKIKNELSMPVVCTIHNSNIMNGGLVGWKQAYIPRILKNMDSVFSVGTQLAKVLENSYAIQNVRVVPNYIDTDRFTIKEHKKSSDFQFLFVGSLEHHKGVMELVQAFHHAKMEDASLHIVGGGSLEKKLEVFIEKNKLHRKVVLHGEVHNDELPEIYNAAHVYVSFSSYETFGITVLEAMACGLPIVYTPSGGPNETVSKDAGIEVLSRKVSDLVNGLKTIKERYNSFDANQIREHVVRNFGSEKSIGVLLETYKILIDEKA